MMFNAQPEVIKRGSKIIFLQYGQIIFVDAMNFGPGCSLDKFGKMWGANVTKGCFPYELFQTIEEMQNEDQWPRLDHFRTTLNRKEHQASQEEINNYYESLEKAIGISKEEFALKITGQALPFNELDSRNFPVELEVYCRMWQNFEESKQNGSMKNMMDYLCHYNAIDTELLADAMTNYISSFITNFKTNPNEHVTLPGMSETILWNHYDKSQYHPYSFNEDYADVSNLIRSQLAGGLSCVFARHVEIGTDEEKFGPRVHRAQNNERFRHLIAFDVNSKLISNRVHLIFI